MNPTRFSAWTSAFVVGIVSFCLLLTTPAEAQDERHPQFDARALVGIPTGQTGDQMPSGGGIGASLMFPVGDGPILLGADLSLLSFSSSPSPNLSLPPTNTALLSGHIVFRLQPWGGTVRPYADLLLGTNHAYTEFDLPQGSVNSHDFGLGYGAGAGIDITIIDRDSDFFLNNLEATGGLRVLGSGLALTQGLPPVGGGAVGSQSSGSWMLVPQLGITTSF